MQPTPTVELKNLRRSINFVRERIQIRNPEIFLRGLQTLVPEHVLNRANGHALRLPVARTSLAEAVQVMMLAYRMGFACDRDFSGWISTLGPRGCAVSAI